jgi:hypothetical protein
MGYIAMVLLLFGVNNFVAVPLTTFTCLEKSDVRQKHTAEKH